jgi:peroxiredoxin
MKKVIYLIIACIIISSCTSKEPRYVVKGMIDGSDSITFYLQKRVDGKIVSFDSAVSKKGNFIMKGGMVKYPETVQLVAGNTKKRYPFYLENSEITITGNLDTLFNSKITGSKSQAESDSLVHSVKPLTDIYSKIITKYQDADKLGDTSLTHRYEKQLDSIQNSITELRKNFVRTQTTSYVSPAILLSLSYEMEADEIESLINGLDTALVALPQIQTLKERVKVMKAVAVGQKAPDFTLSDVDDKPVSLSSKLGPKLLLVDFWAAWCGPCRMENPNVVKVYNEFHKKGFDVFAVSLDRAKEDWVKAIKDDKLTWTHVSDLQYWSSAAAKLYAVNSIPANFLLDETGTIIGKNLRGEALYKKVSETLGAKK